MFVVTTKVFKMSDNVENCNFCHIEKYKYVCPKCNTPYCSLKCYKSPQHLQCSEKFYKNCIQEELASSEPNSQQDIRKIYEILQRMREYDSGTDPDSFRDCSNPLDSDDEPEQAEDCKDETSEMCNKEDEDEEEDLAVRLEGVDINNADEVWERLSQAEQKDFQRIVDSGEIMKLLPEYKPWWRKRLNSKIVEMKSEKAEENEIPKIENTIANYESICKKEPSPCVHYNLWNVLTAYGCMVRFFNGEYETNSSEAAAHLVNLSCTLKYGTNFEDAEDAIISVEMESLTTGNVTLITNVKPTNTKTEVNEIRQQLQADARQLMFSQHFKLAALSDILRLFQMAKKKLKSSNPEAAEFQKLYALCSGSVELNSAKLQQLIKKIEFFLSYVNRRETGVN